jgi:hypothetical protein
MSSHIHYVSIKEFFYDFVDIFNDFMNNFNIIEDDLR